MDIKALFDDFIRYVDSMDDDAVKRSIEDAIVHTADNDILDGDLGREDTGELRNKLKCFT